MHQGFETTAFHDGLIILGVAGLIIPTFARFRVSPIIGFILVGMMVGPGGLGMLAGDYPWLYHITIANAESIEPFAELGIILLLFSIGLELSFRRLVAMRRSVFGVGAAEMIGNASLIGLVLVAMGNSLTVSALLGLALAMSSTALVLPIAGTRGPVGRAAFSMLLFEDLALIPLVIVFASIGGAGGIAELMEVAWKAVLLIGSMLIAGRLLLPPLFAQAARTKSPELFQAVSLLTVILASMATSAIGLSPIIGALIAGVLIAETEYHNEVEVITAPLRGLALGVFLITVGMSLHLEEILGNWIQIIVALVIILVIKSVVTGSLLYLSGSRPGVAAETGLLMSSPSETTLILLGAGATAGLINPDAASFWLVVTAVGLTITPLLATLGRRIARRVDRETAEAVDVGAAAGKTVIFGFGRVGRMVADMLTAHGRPYLAVESDIDGVLAAREEGYDVLFGDVGRRELVQKLELGEAKAIVLTMDDPVLVVRLARGLRREFAELPIIARARDTEHAAKLYKAGVTDAVPEAVEASLQLSEAVLVDIGVAMGPVIASIHEKRSELRAQIMEEGELSEEPSLGRRRLRDAAPG
jgi:CPA2 family monovalent cation:H+ antiporter-2